jgi:hypothetical protein
MKPIKVKLAFPSEKPVNFKFGEINISIGVVATVIEQQYAEKIQKQYPGWIEPVIRSPRKTKKTKEA